MSKYVRDDKAFRRRMGALTDLRKYGIQDSEYDNTFALHASAVTLPKHTLWSVLISVLRKLFRRSYA